MRRFFADAVYWVALAHRKDQWHQRAVEVSRRLGPCLLVTTDEVLSEFLNHFCAHGRDVRSQVARTIRDLLDDPGVQVIPQSRQTFLAGLALYESRLDKEYSLIDCISLQTMRREGITEVLTHDKRDRPKRPISNLTVRRRDFGAEVLKTGKRQPADQPPTVRLRRGEIEGFGTVPDKHFAQEGFVVLL